MSKQQINLQDYLLNQVRKEGITVTISWSYWDSVLNMLYNIKQQRGMVFSG
jgi:hypothetical protein